jgi:hypothetical protein
VSGDWWLWGCLNGQNPDGCIATNGNFRPERVPTLAGRLRELRLHASAAVPLVRIERGPARDAAALQRHDREPEHLGVSPAQVTFDHATHTLTFTFSAALPDGNYQATLSGSVTDASGNHLGDDNSAGSNFAYNFFDLTADVNHDRTVDLADLLILARNFGKPATYAPGRPERRRHNQPRRLPAPGPKLRPERADNFARCDGRGQPHHTPGIASAARVSKDPLLGHRKRGRVGLRRCVLTPGSAAHGNHRASSFSLSSLGRPPQVLATAAERDGRAEETS